MSPGDLFKGFKGGTTDVGTWGERERFGRLQGIGEVRGEVELPDGEFLVSAEGYRAVGELEVELTGPDGSPVSIERHRPPSPYGSRQSLHNLYRVAHGKAFTPGLHEVKVRAPASDRPLVITVGKDLGIGEAFEIFPGGKLLRRLRRGSS